MMNEKYEKLKGNLKGLGNVAVAFSGGVDSTFLLMAAKEALSANVLAITMNSAVIPDREKGAASEFCKEHGIRHIQFESDVLEIPGFADNPPDRCYICKKAIFTKMLDIASKEGFSVLAEGSNLDDDGDYRPGLKAIAELGVRSPLKEAGLSKAEIREISKALGLPTYNKQSMACLASRFVYGETITLEKLSMVEKAENYLYSHGFSQYRVRLHGENLARIEVPTFEMYKIMQTKDEILEEFKKIGFAYVTLDLKGFRSGSMNEVL